MNISIEDIDQLIFLFEESLGNLEKIYSSVKNGFYSLQNFPSECEIMLEFNCFYDGIMISQVKILGSHNSNIQSLPFIEDVEIELKEKVETSIESLRKKVVDLKSQKKSLNFSELKIFEEIINFYKEFSLFFEKNEDKINEFFCEFRKVSCAYILYYRDKRKNDNNNQADTQVEENLEFKRSSYAQDFRNLIKFHKDFEEKSIKIKEKIINIELKIKDLGSEIKDSEFKKIDFVPYNDNPENKAQNNLLINNDLTFVSSSNQNNNHINQNPFIHNNPLNQNNNSSIKRKFYNNLYGGILIFLWFNISSEYLILFLKKFSESYKNLSILDRVNKVLKILFSNEALFNFKDSDSLLGILSLIVVIFYVISYINGKFPRNLDIFWSLFGEVLFSKDCGQKYLVMDKINIFNKFGKFIKKNATIFERKNPGKKDRVFDLIFIFAINFITPILIFFDFSEKLMKTGSIIQSCFAFSGLISYFLILLLEIIKSIEMSRCQNNEEFNSEMNKFINLFCIIETICNFIPNCLKFVFELISNFIANLLEFFIEKPIEFVYKSVCETFFQKKISV